MLVEIGNEQPASYAEAFRTTNNYKPTPSETMQRLTYYINEDIDNYPSDTQRHYLAVGDYNEHVVKNAVKSTLPELADWVQQSILTM